MYPFAKFNVGKIKDPPYPQKRQHDPETASPLEKERERKDNHRSTVAPGVMAKLEQ